TGTGGPRDQQMRHAGEIADLHLARDVLAKRQRNAGPRAFGAAPLQDVPEVHHGNSEVGYLDADDPAARNWRFHANRARPQPKGEVDRKSTRLNSSHGS